tara:strand:+ start:2526 stop:2858 length:333 start_codon:yes stop_codon:yes gene_type:complete
MDSESYIQNLFAKKNKAVSKNSKKSNKKKSKKTLKKNQLGGKLKKLKMDNLKQIAGKLNINKEQVKKYGKCSCKNTYLKAIKNKLKQKGGSYDGYCHDLVSQCSDSFKQC